MEKERADRFHHEPPLATPSLAAAANPSSLSALADAAIPLYTRRARNGGGEDGEPGEERRAQEDEAYGDHPELLRHRLERHRPPHEQAGPRQIRRR